MRLTAIDRIRGFCLLSMLLGHSVLLGTGRQSTELWFAPTSAYHDLAAFALRFVNNTAAPMFFFLLGTSVALLIAGRRAEGVSDRAISGYLAFRGFLLILLQFTLVNTAWRLGEDGLSWPDLSLLTFLVPRTDWLYFGVLWSLGGSLLCLSVLAWFGTRILLPLSAGILIAPEIYLQLLEPTATQSQVPWILGPLAIPGGWSDAWVLYTLIPWLGIALAGLIFGRQLADDPTGTRRSIRRWVTVGGAAYLAFLGLRFLQTDPQNLIDLTYAHRYTPDLQLLAVSVVVNGLLLLLMFRIRLYWIDPLLELFGRTSLFCYVAHLYVIAGFVSLLGRELALEQAVSLTVLVIGVMAAMCRVYMHTRDAVMRRLRQFRRRFI